VTVIYLALSCLIIASVSIRRGNATERGLNKFPWKTYFKVSHLWDEYPGAKCITGLSLVNVCRMVTIHSYLARAASKEDIEKTAQL
jgi:hypothetical protein